MPITHTDGKEYFSAEEVTNTVRERVKKEQETAASWESQYKQAQPQLAQLSTVIAERDQWKQKAAEVEGGLNRYKAAASHGVTDPDTQWALEQAHSRAMSAVPAEKQVAFDAWLPAVKADPSLLPSYLRSVFSAPAGAPAPGAAPAGAPAPASAPAPNAAPAGGPAPASRPAWASASTGQAPVPTGATPDFGARVKGAKTLDDLSKIAAESRQG